MANHLPIHQQPTDHHCHLLDHRTKAYCQLSSRLSIQLGGRQVDVLIKDPSSLPSPIYTLALQTGIVL
ncbi:MAG: hypothetical protein RIR83_1301 [Pseudomonadota bacterium]